MCAWSLAPTLRNLLIATSMASLRLHHSALSVQGGFFSRLALPVCLDLVRRLPPLVRLLLLHPLPVSWPPLRPCRLRRPSFSPRTARGKGARPLPPYRRRQVLSCVLTHDRTCAWLFHFPSVAWIEEGTLDGCGRGRGGWRTAHSLLYMNGGRYTPFPY